MAMLNNQMVATRKVDTRNCGEVHEEKTWFRDLTTHDSVAKELNAHRLHVGKDL